MRPRDSAAARVLKVGQVTLAVLGTLHRGFARRLARHAGIRIFRFFERALETGGAKAVPAGFSLRILDEREVLSLCADTELDLSAGMVRAAHARGDLCVGAFDAAGLTGYCWLAFAPTPHLDGVWVDFRADMVWIYKSLVRVAHRGKGIAPALYYFSNDVAMQRGRERSIICVENHNRPSFAAAMRSGHAAAGYAAYLVRRGTLSTWYSPAAQRNEIRFHFPHVGEAGKKVSML